MNEFLKNKISLSLRRSSQYICVYIVKSRQLPFDHIDRKKEENDLREKNISSFKNSWRLGIALNDIQNN